MNFWKAALIRAVRTLAQTAIATIGTAAVISDVNWLYVLSASALAALISILTSIVTGLPEVQTTVFVSGLSTEETDEISDNIFDNT